MKGEEMPVNRFEQVFRNGLQFLQDSNFELSMLISSFDPPVAAYLRGKPHDEGLFSKLKSFFSRVS